MRASLFSFVVPVFMLSGACATSSAAESAGPAAAAPPALQAVERIALVNPGFESDRRGPTGHPEGWDGVQHAGEVAYRFTLDPSIRHSGKQSLRIVNLRPEFYGSMVQSVPAAGLVGKTLRFAVWLKTEKIKSHGFTRGATMTLHANLGGSPLASADFRKAAFDGTTDWTQHEVLLTIPPRTESIEIGIMMTGSGIIWADDVELDVVAPQP